MRDVLKDEFMAALNRAGLTIEADRMAAMYEGFLGYRDLAALLDADLPLDLEPAGLYVPDALDRP
jgi:hypothetical protein